MPIAQNSDIILDTCFLIKASEYSSTPFFDKIFQQLIEKNCIPVITDFIRFEFLKGCKTKKQIEAKNNYLSSFVFMDLPFSQEIIKSATSISNIYSNKNINSNQISIIDLCNSAFLKKHSKDLFLISLDNSDYPICLHDRVDVITIDTDKEILTFGIYKFNEDKFNSIIADIYKA
jgi:hypothetical protein